METTRSKADVIKAIDESMGQVIHNHGEYLGPKVCIVCDRLLYIDKIHWLSRTKLINRKDVLMPIVTIPETVQSFYKYTGKGFHENMRYMMLSPLGCYNEEKREFAVCPTCHSDLYKYVVRPYFSLANNFAFGDAPTELTILNEIELALVARCRISGHIFNFHGGSHKCITGMHSLYDVNLAHVEGSLEHMERMGFPKVIACVISGPFTKNQKKHIRQKMTINRDNVVAALQWLRANNIHYKDIDQNMINSIPQPTVIDTSEQCNSENNNVEMSETYTFVFPDATCNTANAGCDNTQQLKEILLELKKKGNDFSLASYSTDNILRDFESHTLEKAFPLQFPYGIGGRNDLHWDNKDQPKVEALEQYIEYLIDRATPTFQTPTLLLILCNVVFRNRIMRRSCWQVTAKTSDELFVQNVATLDPSRLSHAIEAEINGTSNFDNTSKDLLQSIRTVCRALPHTNEAARDARGNIYSLMQCFGLPAIFFTVSPDDLHNLRMQIYFNNPWDLGKDFINISDEEMKATYNKRVEFRIAYPGYGAYDFEQVIATVIKHVIGWDISKGKSCEFGGLFGIAEAFNATVEEQGRKSLHAHFAVFLKRWNAMLRALATSQSREEIRELIENIETFFDSIGSTELINDSKAIKHMCPSAGEQEISLEIVSDAKLRALRHQNGCTYYQGVFAECPGCTKTLTCEEAASNYLNLQPDLGTIASLPDTYTGRLESIRMQMMIPLFDVNRNNALINALVNLHASKHRKPCFSKSKECRHRYPQLPLRRTTLETFQKIDWYDWKGVSVEQDIYEMKIKRRKEDLYMNVYCPVISESCFTCNSNISLIFNGRFGIYMSNYLSKGTQEDDSDSYRRMIETVKRRFTKQMYEVERSETMSRLMSCVFAHTRAHTISAPMARFLIRHKNRFLFSHEFMPIPLDTLLRIITDKPFYVRIHQRPKHAFFVSKAFDYLYRPQILENISVYEFFLHYESVNIKHNKKYQLLHFMKPHPQIADRALRHHNRHIVPKYACWKWPNTLKFGGDIFRNDTINNKQADIMDMYAKWTLVMFQPFRVHSDLVLNNCYRMRLLQCSSASVPSLYSQWRTILCNIQNIRNNGIVAPSTDLLESRSAMFQPTTKGQRKSDEDSNTKDNLDEDLDKYIELSQHMEYDEFDELDEFEKYVLDKENLSFVKLCKKGAHNSGSDFVIDVEEPKPNTFITTLVAPLPNTTTEEELNCYHKRGTAGMTSLIEVAAKRKVRIVENQQGEICRYPMANGSVSSMIEWSKAAKLDKEQSLAFYTLIATFVLTYYEESLAQLHIDGPNRVNEERHRRRSTNRNTINRHINLLKAMNGQSNLCLFLTGAGGSGKSYVIEHVLSYANEYCDNIAVPFTDRTIVVTALTGVAAVLIKGETLHSAGYVYNREINEKMINHWSDSRLLIVDEISFADKELLEQVDANMKELKQNHYKPYGGLNIAFMGDFRQLEPIGQDPLYRDYGNAIWYEWINCFIELKGNHRASQDPMYAALLERFRNGTPSQEDIDTINKRVVKVDTEIPNDIQYACPSNKDRCAINNAIFTKHIIKTHSKVKEDPIPKHTIMIGADDIFHVSKIDKKKRAFGLKRLLFERCSESDCTLSGQTRRIDPLLKLYNGCPVMLIFNTDVKTGEANGCSCTVTSIVLKHGETIQKRCVDGYWVNFVGASQVSHIVVTSDLHRNQTFVLTSSKHAVRVRFPRPSSLSTDTGNTSFISIRLRQFALNVNHATTGHKLQGKTLDKLFISSWSYSTNWPYVLLSRVRTLSGLYLRKELMPATGKKARDYSMPKELDRMLRIFRRDKQPKAFEEFDPVDICLQCEQLRSSLSE
jgi:hypothetical protein